MTDPFDALRREAPAADPDPDFVDTLMRAVQERLDTHHAAPPLVAATTLIDPEVVPMHSIRRPATRWLVIAAAAAAAIVGILVVAGHSGSRSIENTPSTSTPPTSPVLVSTTAPAVPAAGVPAVLANTIWLRGPHATSGSGVAVRFTDSTIALGAPNNLTGLSFSSTVIDGSDGTIRLVTGNPVTNCNKTDAGRYSWSVSTNGRTLTLATLDDPCADRAALVPGTYLLDACREKDTTCLGDLDAGTHASQYFRPLIRRTDQWRPLYGGLTYTVADGWANWSDWPDSVGLAPSALFAATSNDSPEPASAIEVLAHVLPAVPGAACSGNGIEGANDAAAVLTALRSMKGLVIGASTPVTIDGHSGVAVDLRADAASMTPCTGATTMDYLNISPGNSETIGPDDRTRLILLDVVASDSTSGGGASIVVAIRINVHDPAAYDSFVATAMQVVQTFRFS